MASGRQNKPSPWIGTLRVTVQRRGRDHANFMLGVCGGVHIGGGSIANRAIQLSFLKNFPAAARGGFSYMIVVRRLTGVEER